MPWKATSVMQARLQFVADCLSAQEPMTVLCERYGISRQTGYKWTQRFAEEGARGLEERSRAPHHHGRATAAELVVELIQARQRKPYWGPRKLLAMLGRQYPDWPWPAPSTVADMLRREGLSEPRRRRRRALTVEQPFAAVDAANDAWCIDFKGWFRTGDGTRCDPLTVSDAHSRYLLGLEIIEPVTSAVEKITDRLFGCRPAVRRIWSARTHPLRQWSALCLFGCRRADPAVGALGQDGDRAGTDLSGQAAAERPA